MISLIYKSSTTPSVEIYEDCFIIDGEKYNYQEVFKVLYLKGKPSWWFRFLIILLVLVTFSYQNEVTEGKSEFKIYLKNKKGSIGKTLILKLKDSTNEMDSVVEMINNKILTNSVT